MTHSRFSIVSGLVLTAVVSLCGLAAAPAVGQAALERITEVEGITEYRLSNGLKVLLFPDPTASTVTVNVTYRVGSRHEGMGEKGMAHLLEHMVFKGTQTRENIWVELQDHGAQFNGTTSSDRTNYFETLPASEENLYFALEMEADRMVSSRISGEELATEMTVVRNEFEAGENSPGRILQQRIMSAAYDWHNYGFSTIGNRSDLERVPVENLRRFYEKYYQPDNATLVVAGKFDAEPSLEKITQTFGVIPRPERVLQEPYTIEPDQDGARSVVLRRVGGVAAAGVAYHIPSGADPEIVALDVLSDVLSQRPSGRLYKALVESGAAARVSSFAYSRHDPSLFIVDATVAGDAEAQPLLEELIGVVETVAGTVTEEEVERSKANQLKNIKLAATDSRRIGLSLSEGEAMGDWRLLFLLRDHLKNVTAADVNLAAERYLVESNRTSGIYVPTDEPKRAPIRSAPDVQTLVTDYKGSETIQLGEAFAATAENIDASVERSRVGSMRLAFLPKSTRGQVVTAALYFPYGTLQSLEGHRTALEMLPALMMRGAGELGYQALRDKLDQIETQLNVGGGAGFVRADLKTTRENLPAAIELVADILRRPRLPAEELETLKQERQARLESMKSDPQAIVFNELSRILSPYPEHDVRYSASMEERIELIGAVELEEIRELYSRLLGSDHLRAAFVGDFDADEVTGLLKRSFAGWSSEEPYERLGQTLFDVQAGSHTFNTPDKQMAIVARATAFPMQDDDPDYSALVFANFVFGESTNSRLMTALRHDGGLSYGAGSSLQVDDERAVAELFGYAICAPQNANEAQTVMRGEFDRWLADGLSQQEIEDSLNGYLEQHKTALANDRVVVQQMLRDLRTGRDFRYRQKIVDAAKELNDEEVLAAVQRLASQGFVDLVGGDVSKFDEAP